jgi:hypothetical protein
MIEKKPPWDYYVCHFAFASKGKLGTRFNKRPANGHDHSLAVSQLLQMH